MKPVNRKEIFMTALAKGEEVGIEPVTREEMLLAEQAKREAGSSGGGGGGEKKIILYATATSGSTVKVTPNVTFEEAREMLTNFNFSGIFFGV